MPPASAEREKATPPSPKGDLSTRARKPPRELTSNWRTKSSKRTRLSDTHRRAFVEPLLLSGIMPLGGEPMARGWESKSVESQIEDAADRAQGGEPLDAGEREVQRKVQ